MSWLSSLVGTVFGNHNAPTLGGVTSLTRPPGTTFTSAPPTPTPTGLPTGDASGGASTGGIDWSGLLKGIGSTAVNNIPLILAGLGAYSSAKQGSQSSKEIDEALALARQRDAALQPLRDAGIGGALKAYQTPVTPYAAEHGYTDTGNPYTHTLAGAPAPAPASPMAALTGVTPLVPVAARRAKLRGT